MPKDTKPEGTALQPESVQEPEKALTLEDVKAFMEQEKRAAILNPSALDPKELANISQLKMDQFTGFLNLVKDWRIWLLATPATILGAEYVPDTQGMVKAIIVLLLALSFSHIARKVLIPSIDNQALVTLMGNNPLALAFVYVSNTALYIAIVSLFVWIL